MSLFFVYILPFFLTIGMFFLFSATFDDKPVGPREDYPGIDFKCARITRFFRTIWLILALIPFGGIISFVTLLITYFTRVANAEQHIREDSKFVTNWLRK